MLVQVDAEMRLAVQEALSLMASAFRDLSDLNRTMMEALLMEAIDKVGPDQGIVLYQCS